MNISYFELSLKKYIMDHHPDLITDDDFIKTRSASAEAVFAEKSKEGKNIVECKEHANEILFAGLHYSLYDSIIDILEENYSHYEINAKVLLKEIKPTLTQKYDITDRFLGTDEEQNLLGDIIELIDLYIEKNGIQ